MKNVLATVLFVCAAGSVHAADKSACDALVAKCNGDKTCVAQAWLEEPCKGLAPVAMPGPMAPAAGAPAAPVH